MRLYKKAAVCLLAAAMALSMMTACGPENSTRPGGGSHPGSGGSSGSETPAPGEGGSTEDPGTGESKPGTGEGGSTENPGTGESKPGTGEGGSAEKPGTDDGKPGTGEGGGTTEEPSEKVIPWVRSQTNQYAEIYKKGTYRVHCIDRILEASDPSILEAKTPVEYDLAQKEEVSSSRFGMPGRLDGESWSIVRENNTYRIDREQKQVLILPGKIPVGDELLWTLPFTLGEGDVTRGTEEIANETYQTEFYSCANGRLEVTCYFQEQTGKLTYCKSTYTDEQKRWYTIWIEYQEFTDAVDDSFFEVPTEDYTVIDLRTN